MAAERATDNSVNDDPARGRESGIVELAEASGAAGGAPAQAPHGDEVDIDTDEADTDEAAAPTLASAVGASDDDDVTVVEDDEIEMADPAALRASLPPPPLSVARSRPPARPTSRPRSSSLGSSLPPPRALSSAPPGSAWPSSVSPGSSRAPAHPWADGVRVDRWALANRTLELSRAQARVRELEEQLAWRDARIQELEAGLAEAERRLRELEKGPSPFGAPLELGAGSSEAEPPVVTETRPVIAAGGTRRSRVERVANDALEKAGDGVSSSDGGAQEAASNGASAPRSPSEDDLRQISVIGPRYEAALREQGITRLSQIAAWSEADVRQVAKALKIPKSRIVKGRWVEAAREAMALRPASE